MFGAVLDHTVESPQVVAVRPRQFRVFERVQDRLVILVDEHNHLLAGLLAKTAEQNLQTIRPVHVLRCRIDAGVAFDDRELGSDIARQIAGFVVLGAEAQPQYREFVLPVPAVVDIQTAE